MIEFRVRMFYTDKSDLDENSKPDFEGIVGVTLKNALLTLSDAAGSKNFIVDGIEMGGTWQPSDAMVVWGFYNEGSLLTNNSNWKRVKVEMYHPTKRKSKSKES